MEIQIFVDLKWSSQCHPHSVPSRVYTHYAWSSQQLALPAEFYVCTSLPQACALLHTVQYSDWVEETHGHGGGLHMSPPYAAEHTFPWCSQRLLSAFSFEHLMGFTLLSDTCWKCNCAHNCCVGMEVCLFPKAGASLRKQRGCFLHPCWWSMWLAFPDLFWAAGQED